MSARRILIVGPLPGHMGSRSTGGIATHVLELAEGLSSAGHDVAVYADNMPPTDEPIAEEWGDVYSATPLSKSLGGAMAALGNASLVSSTRSLMGLAEAQDKRFGPTFAQVLGLSRAVQGHRPDVVHYHQPDMRVLYGRMAGITSLPSVATQHSLSAFADDAPQALGDLVIENLAEMDAVIAVSTDVADGLSARVPGLEPTVIPNGVDLGRFGAAMRSTSDVESRGSAATGSSPATVAYIGRIAAGKGVEDLLRAMVSVLASVPNAHLVLAGPVVDLDVESLAREAGLDAGSCELLGDLGPDGVVDTLSSADVFVLPSHLREGQPRSIIEALASGTPVVASCIGGIPNLLRGGAGELVDPGDVAALGRAITRVLTEPEFAARLIEVGAARAEEYDLGRTTERVAEVYESVIE